MSAEIKLHKTCYSSLTSEHHIQSFQKKADVSETEINEPTSRSGRRSLDPVAWTKCMFCQAVKREELHNVEYMNKSKQKMEDASLDSVMII